MTRGREIDWARVRAEAFERFGVRRFRRGQRELVEAALSGRDALGVLPAGEDRSLAFQLAASILPGAVVVVSPAQDGAALVAGEGGVAQGAAREGDSTPDAGEARGDEAATPARVPEVIHLTPERLEGEEALALLSARKVSLLVVDEAHHVSERGPDFRPAYQGLAGAAKSLGRPPILALTGPGPQQVIEDIAPQLALVDPLFVSAALERENVFFEVRECPETSEKEAALRDALRKAGGGPAVVYCATVRAATEVHERLVRAGVAAELFHGKRRAGERDELQRRLLAGEARVIVATSAFGAGAERTGLRLVVHWNFPDSVETYWEEACRAGGGGSPAHALLLYRPEDRRIQSFFLGGRYPPREELRATWNALERAGTHPTPVKKIAAEAGLTDRRAQLAISLLRTLGAAEKRGGGFRKARDFATPEAWDAFLTAYERRAELDRDRLRAIVRYAQTALCRMQAMRTYFAERAGRPCGHCDNCRDRPQVAAEVLRAEAGPRPGLG